MPTFALASQVFSPLAEASGLIKIAFFLIGWSVLWLPIALPLAIKLQWRPPQPLTMPQKLPLVGSLYLLAPVILWGFAWIEGLPFTIYGLRPELSVVGSLFLGIAVGSFGLVCLFSLQLALGWVGWQPEHLSTFRNVLLPTLIVGLGISAIEEMIFRGFMLNQLMQQFSPGIAAIVCSLIFALLHLVWEGRDNVPQLPGLWLMGMVLCLARASDSGSLGLAWGLHTGWIWVMASLDTAQLIYYTGNVPVGLTGVDGKPLAGLMGLLFLLITSVVLIYLPAGIF